MEEMVKKGKTIKEIKIFRFENYDIFLI